MAGRGTKKSEVSSRQQTLPVTAAKNKEASSNGGLLHSWETMKVVNNRETIAGFDVVDGAFADRMLSALVRAISRHKVHEALLRDHNTSRRDGSSQEEVARIRRKAKRSSESLRRAIDNCRTVVGEAVRNGGDGGDGEEP